MVTLIRFMIFRNVGSSTQVDYFYYYHHPLRKEMVTLRCTCTLFLMSRRPFQKSVWNMEKITVCVYYRMSYIQVLSRQQSSLTLEVGLFALKQKKSAISKVQKHIFCYFKNGRKSIFALEKSLELPKMQFSDFFKSSSPRRLLNPSFLLSSSFSRFLKF